jgi:hypothetical protein
VREVEFIFSKAIPADIVTLHQRPFTMDNWRRGPNPGEVECVILYKVRTTTYVVYTSVKILTETTFFECVVGGVCMYNTSAAGVQNW